MTTGAIPSGPESISEHAPVLAIAVAAELAGMHPQTLRQYDRLGLVSPQRTSGGTRRYSLRDVARLRQIAQLSAEGFNLQGILRIFELEERAETLTRRVRDLEAALEGALSLQPNRRVFAAGTAGEVVPLRRGTRIKRDSAVTLWRPIG